MAIKKLILESPHKKIFGQYNLFKAWLQDKIITSYMWNKIFRKQIFDNIHFYEDRYLMCQLLTSISNIYISDIGTYYYYERENQIIQKNSISGNSSINNLRRYEYCQIFIENEYIIKYLYKTIF
jgi:glycosyltransferase EpsH